MTPEGYKGGVTSKHASTACACAAIAAYGVALGSVVDGYPRALDTACPDGARAPAAFWPLLAVAVGLAVASYAIYRRRRGEYGGRSRADVLSLVVVVAVPLATVATIVGYAFTYACWE